MKRDSEIFGAACGYIDAHHDDIIAMWKRFVDLRSDATEKERADAMAVLLKSELEAIGCECRLYDVGEKNGYGLEAVLGKERPGRPVMFTGHYDVVPLKGDHKFFIDEENKAHGLGCLDMKGGIVMSIWIAKALTEAGWNGRPIKFVFVGDEENGHQWGDTKHFLVSHGGGGVCAFNMETGLLNNAICIGRKGTGQATVTVRGVAAHSGNNYSEGRSAITEMAQKIPQIEALTDLDANTTVAVTMIQGGTVQNSIPPVCSCTVDLRFGSVAERDRVLAALEEICGHTTVDQTTAEFEFREFMAPFDSSEEVLKLADFVGGISEEYGFGSMGRVFLGGGSDASFILLGGTPVICSMGVQGQFNHSDHEYALVDSMFKRAKLLAAAVLRISDLEKH
ncbi:M20/M25/M40 family metallo-hydrolase [Clostridium sp. AN503]|uniref:M20/M25/M40 family metallo-hydrolase n=1 Tax=Clostridium sp. AN503 TaxID=3160598 RepID=UPI0034597CF8